HLGRSVRCPWECCSSLDSLPGRTSQLQLSPKANVVRPSGLLHAHTEREASASRNRPFGRTKAVQETGSPLGELFGTSAEAARPGTPVAGGISGSRYCLEFSYFH